MKLIVVGRFDVDHISFYVGRTTVNLSRTDLSVILITT